MTFPLIYHDSSASRPLRPDRLVSRNPGHPCNCTAWCPADEQPARRPWLGLQAIQQRRCHAFSTIYLSAI